MKTWILLLRGVNVGGNNILPMQVLRNIVEDLGHQNVKTYIQSGNCVFNSEEHDASQIGNLIAERIDTELGFRLRVWVISLGDVEAALAANPYPQAMADPKSLHFFFLSEPAPAANLEAMTTLKMNGEAYTLGDTIFYLWAPDGIGRSKLAEKAERHIGVALTARNLRSVMKIIELARAAQDCLLR